MSQITNSNITCDIKLLQTMLMEQQSLNINLMKTNMEKDKIIDDMSKKEKLLKKRLKSLKFRLYKSKNRGTQVRKLHLKLTKSRLRAEKLQLIIDRAKVTIQQLLHLNQTFYLMNCQNN